MGRPEAILCVSAHWNTAAPAVGGAERPETIHDFGGFPRPLYEFQYPAPGAPDLARRIAELLQPVETGHDQRWGLDHGTWSLLVHLYPEADIPVVQLGIDETSTAQEHYDLARRLGALRDEGVLILGSGNVVHNLHTYAWGRKAVEPYDWAVRFESRLRELLASHTPDPLVAYETFGGDAELAVPTPDHYLPLLYVLALRTDDDEVTYPAEGFDGGSVSMLTVQISPATAHTPPDNSG